MPRGTFLKITLGGIVRGIVWLEPGIVKLALCLPDISHWFPGFREP